MRLFKRKEQEPQEAVLLSVDQLSPEDLDFLREFVDSGCTVKIVIKALEKIKGKDAKVENEGLFYDALVKKLAGMDESEQQTVVEEMVQPEVTSLKIGDRVRVVRDRLDPMGGRFSFTYTTRDWGDIIEITPAGIVKIRTDKGKVIAGIDKEDLQKIY